MKTQMNHMFELAKRAMANAYAPYSKFTVGACLRDENNQLFTGANVENAVFRMTNCAESNAIGAMASSGSRKILDLVVIAQGPLLVSPCGSCRQQILEFADEHTHIHLCNAQGIQQSLTIDKLLPYAFGSQHFYE